jgi:hypothetical protein
MRLQFTPTRMTKIQNIDNTKCHKDMEQQELWFCCWEWYSHCGSLESSYKVKNELTIRSTNCTPSHVTKYIENLYTKTCIGMFIAALFKIAKMWIQSNCILTGEHSTSIQWNISVGKRNEQSIQDKTRMNLKYILLSRRIKSEDCIYCNDFN